MITLAALSIKVSSISISSDGKLCTYLWAYTFCVWPPLIIHSNCCGFTSIWSSLSPHVLSSPTEGSYCFHTKLKIYSSRLFMTLNMLAVVQSALLKFVRRASANYPYIVFYINGKSSFYIVYQHLMTTKDVACDALPDTIVARTAMAVTEFYILTSVSVCSPF